MKKSIKISAIFALAAAAAAGPAAAQDSGLYLGGSFGSAEYSDLCEGVAAAATGCRDHDEAWRAFAGYRFNRNFSAELGFANLGTVRAVAPGEVLDIETRSWDLSALLSFPVANRFSLFGRLGAYRARTTGEVVSGAGTTQGGDSSSGFTYGAGLGLDVGPLGVRLEWQRYDNVSGTAVREDTIDVFSAGALFRF